MTSHEHTNKRNTKYPGSMPLLSLVLSLHQYPMSLATATRKAVSVQSVHQLERSGTAQSSAKYRVNVPFPRHQLHVRRPLRPPKDAGSASGSSAVADTSKPSQGLSSNCVYVKLAVSSNSSSAETLSSGVKRKSSSLALKTTSASSSSSGKSSRSSGTEAGTALDPAGSGLKLLGPPCACEHKAACLVLQQWSTATSTRHGQLGMPWEIEGRTWVPAHR
jgi:hypothetical protein